MGLTSSVSDLYGNYEPYSVTADFSTGATKEVTGDRTTSLFKQDESEDQMMDFLTLLTAQLQHQDPLSPMENTQFVEQLAQFSQLEAFTNVDKSMTKLGENFEESLGIQNLSAQSMTNASAVSLVGKEVRLRQSMIDYGGSDSMEFKVQMGNRSSVTVEIFDANQETITTFDVTEKDLTNAGTFVWDGTDEHGQKVASDEYALYIHGQEADPSLYCFVEDTVQGLRYSAEGPMIKVSGQELPVANILEVNHNAVAGGTATNGGFGDLTLGQALGLKGSSVKMKSSDINYKPEPNKSKELFIDFGGQASVTIEVKNPDGKVVQTFQQDASAGNKIEIPHKNHDNSPYYTISTSGNSGSYFYEEAKITGVKNNNGIIKLIGGGKEISLKSVIEISSET